MSLGTAIGKYWREHGQHIKSCDRTWEMIEALQAGLGSSLPLTALTNKKIADYVSKRRGDMKTVRGIEVPARGAASINREIGTLRAILNRAATVWDVDFKMPNWKFHRLTEPAGRDRALTDEEEKKLLLALRPDLRPLVRFCLITGARVSSARSLTWSAVDMAAGELRLTVKSKKRGSRLTLEIVPELAALLAEVKDHHPIHVFTYHCQKTKEGTKTQEGRQVGERYPFSKTGWRKTWQSALRRAGISDFRFHDLRHTAATQMLRSSGDLAAVSAVLGHCDVKTTERYAHVLKGAKGAAMSRSHKNPQNIPRVEEKEKAEATLNP